MSDIKAYENLTAEQQLNLFRNLYYTDGNATENGIIANAINDILPEYNRQKAEIEGLRDGCSNCLIVQTKSEIICELHEQIEYWQRGYNDLKQTIKITKSETIKEFAEQLKKAKAEAYKELENKIQEYLAKHIAVSASYLSEFVRNLVEEAIKENV